MTQQEKHLGRRGDPEGHRAAGLLGGAATSSKPGHMAAIGRRGGISLSQDREHMAELGRKGGLARAAKLRAQQEAEAEKI